MILLLCLFPSTSPHHLFTNITFLFPFDHQGNIEDSFLTFSWFFCCCFFCFSFLTDIEVASEASPPAKQLISQTRVLLAESVRRSKEAKRKSEQPGSFLPTAWDGLCRFLFTATYSTTLAWLLCYQFSINLPHNRRVRAPVLILPDSVTLSWED